MKGVDADQKTTWTVDKYGYLRLWSTSTDPRTWQEEYENGTLNFPDHWTLNKVPDRAPVISPKPRDFYGQDAEDRKFANLLKSQKKKKGDDQSHRGMLLTQFRTTTKRVPKASIRCLEGHPYIHRFPWIAVAGLNRPPEVYDIHKQMMIYQGKHQYHYLGHQHKC